MSTCESSQEESFDFTRSMLILIQVKHSKRLVCFTHSYHWVSCHHFPLTPIHEPLLGTMKNRRTHWLHLRVFILQGRTTISWPRHWHPNPRGMGQYPWPFASALSKPYHPSSIYSTFFHPNLYPTSLPSPTPTPFICFTTTSHSTPYHYGLHC